MIVTWNVGHRDFNDGVVFSNVGLTQFPAKERVYALAAESIVDSVVEFGFDRTMIWLTELVVREMCTDDRAATEAAARAMVLVGEHSSIVRASFP